MEIFGNLPFAPLSTLKVLSNHNLNFEQFHTLLTQIEAILNSHQILPLTSDPTELEALTPGHFLIGSFINWLKDSGSYEAKTAKSKPLHQRSK
ncbi:hypothetical protein D910_01943 [Dendroctonus ponderosae]